MSQRLALRSLAVAVFAACCVSMTLGQSGSGPNTPGTVAWGKYSTVAAPPSPPAAKEAPGTLKVLGTYTVNPSYSLKEAQLKLQYKGPGGGAWITQPPNPALWNGEIGQTVQNPPGSGPITVEAKPYSLGRGPWESFLRVEYYYIPNPASPPPSPQIFSAWSAVINFTL